VQITFPPIDSDYGLKDAAQSARSPTSTGAALANANRVSQPDMIDGSVATAAAVAGGSTVVDQLARHEPQMQSLLLLGRYVELLVQHWTEFEEQCHRGSMVSTTKSLRSRRILKGSSIVSTSPALADQDRLTWISHADAASAAAAPTSLGAPPSQLVSDSSTASSVTTPALGVVELDDQAACSQDVMAELNHLIDEAKRSDEVMSQRYQRTQQRVRLHQRAATMTGDRSPWPDTRQATAVTRRSPSLPTSRDVTGLLQHSEDTGGITPEHSSYMPTPRDLAGDGDDAPSMHSTTSFHSSPSTNSRRMSQPVLHATSTDVSSAKKRRGSALNLKLTVPTSPGDAGSHRALEPAGAVAADTDAAPVDPVTRPPLLSVDAQTGILLTQGTAGIPETLSALPVLDQRADALEECDLAASGKARVADSTVQAIDRDSRMQDTISEAFLLMSPRSQHSVLNSLLAQYANSRVLL